MKSLLFVLLSAAAWAAPVDKLLGAREHVITAAEVRALGPHADRILIGVASDANQSRLRRTRALLSLRHVPSVEARDFLRAVIAQKREAVDGPDVLELSAALGALQPYGPEVLGDLLPFVSHRSANVRHAAVVALGGIDDPAAKSALRARLAVERDPGVRDAAARALAKP